LFLLWGLDAEGCPQQQSAIQKMYRRERTEGLTQVEDLSCLFPKQKVENKGVVHGGVSQVHSYTSTVNLF